MKPDPIAYSFKIITHKSLDQCKVSLERLTMLPIYSYSLLFISQTAKQTVAVYKLGEGYHFCLTVVFNPLNKFSIEGEIIASASGGTLIKYNKFIGFFTKARIFTPFLLSICLILIGIRFELYILVVGLGILLSVLLDYYQFLRLTFLLDDKIKYQMLN